MGLGWTQLRAAMLAAPLSHALGLPPSASWSPSAQLTCVRAKVEREKVICYCASSFLGQCTRNKDQRTNTARRFSRTLAAPRTHPFSVSFGKTRLSGSTEAHTFPSITARRRFLAPCDSLFPLSLNPLPLRTHSRTHSGTGMLANTQRCREARP